MWLFRHSFFSFPVPKRKKTKPVYAMSRRSKAGLIALFVLLAAVAVLIDHGPVSKTLRAVPKSEDRLKAYDLEKYHDRTFTVTKVVDGDTIDIDIPDGNYPHTRIRLWGIDTPETKSPKVGIMYFGPQAAQFTKKLALEKQVTVYLEERRTRGKYGRLLAYVQLPDKRYLNEVLLKEGYAYADLRFRHSFYNKYKQLESAARSGKKGLWEKVTREQLPEWLQRKKPNLLNK